MHQQIAFYSKVINIREFSCLGNMCNDCMARVPYATLIATIMCCLGVGIFCGTMYRGATLCALMMDQVNHTRAWFFFFKIKIL